MLSDLERLVAIQEIKEMIPMPRKRAGGQH